MTDAILDKVAQDRQALHSRLDELDEQEKSLDEERRQVEQRASELEEQIRQLAQQEAEIQRKKKELQSRAKQIGQSRTQYIRHQKKLEKDRASVRSQLEQLQQQEEKAKKELSEEQRLRHEIEAQDAAWRKQEKARQEAIRREQEEKKRRMEAKARENRTAPRIAVAVDISMHTEHNFYMGLTENLSEGGLFIATYDTLPIGTKLALTLNLPDSKPIEAQCEVRWVREYNKFTEDATPGIGVRFLDLSEKHQEIIRTFLSQRDPILYDEV